MANQVLVKLDLTNIESADDGNTTYYGGTFVFNGEERQAKGNDRSDSYHYDIRESIMELCKAEWPELHDDANDLAYNLDIDVGEAFDQVENDHNGVGTITIIKDSGLFVVTTGSVPSGTW